MQNININSRCGQFGWKATGTVSDAVAKVLTNYGALQIVQRSPSTAAEKLMAGYDKRPKNFERSSIPFTEENAEKLRNALSSVQIEIGRDEKDQPIVETVTFDVEVERHVSSTEDVKMSDERKAYARNAGKLDKLAARVAYEGELGNGTESGAPVEFLRAIRAWTKARLAELEA